jgi:GNAT superfamily N-acetyltransferase
MNVHIREARRADAEPISSLLSQLGYPAPAEVVAQRIDRLRAGVLVAEVGGRVVGMAAFHAIPHVELDEPTARLTSLVVAEEARGQGIGRALVERVEAGARALGCGRIELTSGDQRTEAHAFYRRLGFADHSRRFVKELED